MAMATLLMENDYGSKAHSQGYLVVSTLVGPGKSISMDQCAGGTRAISISIVLYLSIYLNN